MTRRNKKGERVYAVTPEGFEYTDAVTEALADEAEQGYDFEGWTVVYPGRPSLSGEREESPRVSFRLAPDVRDRAVERAEREGKSVSQLARDALEQYLATG